MKYLHSIIILILSIALFLLLISCQSEAPMLTTTPVSTEPISVATEPFDPTLIPSPAGASTVLEENPPTQEPATPTIAATTELGSPALTKWRFTRSSPGGGGAFGEPAIGPNGQILVGSDLSGAYLSDETGLDWQPIGARNGLFTTHVSSVAFDSESAEILYLGTEAGLFRSSDGGASVLEVLSGGYVTAVSFAPSDPTRGIAALNSDFDIADGTLYQTFDRGLSWMPLATDNGLPQTLHVLRLMIDPADPNLLYLLTGEGRFACSDAALYGSNDGGASWAPIGEPAWQVIDFGIDPANPDHLWLTTYGDVWDDAYRCVGDDLNEGGLYQSFDRGASWGGADVQPGNYLIWVGNGPLRLLEIDFGEMWEMDGSGGFGLVSTKEGWSTGWSGASHTYGASFDGDLKTIAAHPLDPNQLVWIDSQFVYGTSDGGQNFRPLTSFPTAVGWQSTGIDNIVMYDFAISADGETYYAAMPDLGCFVSPDRGVSWINCNVEAYVGNWFGNGGNSMTIAADPSRPEVAWITMANEIEGAAHTLLKTADRGLTWQESHAGLPQSGTPNGLSVDPTSPEEKRILFITFDGDLYRSADDGASWEMVFDCGGCRTVAVDHVDGELVFAGGEAGLFRSDLGGRPNSWQPIGPAEMAGELSSIFWDTYWEGVREIVTHPTEREVLFAVVSGVGKGLYRSDDAGESWQLILQDDFMRTLRLNPHNLSEIWAGSSSALHSGGYDPGSRGLLVSQDGGASWDQLDFGSVWPFVNTISFDPVDPTRVVVGSTGTGFYVGER